MVKFPIQSVLGVCGVRFARRDQQNKKIFIGSIIIGVVGMLLGVVPVQQAQARTYEWQEVPVEDLQVIPDADLEQTIRLLLISKAVQRLDIVTFDQRNDSEYGRPTLEAIREAANRGVKVRFMTSWVSSVFDEKWRNDIAEFLTIPPTRSPIEYLIVGGSAMEEHGFLSRDTIHEKLLIVDGKWALVTGRGHAGVYRNWLDMAYVFRGRMVLQFVEAFEELWNFVEPRNRAFVPPIDPTQVIEQGRKSYRRKAGRGRSQTQQHIAQVIGKVSDVHLSALSTLFEWLKEPVRADSRITRTEVASGQVHRMRLLHHDLLSQLDHQGEFCNQDPCDLGMKDRLTLLSDPVIDSVIEVLKDPSIKEFRYATLAVTMNPRLKNFFLRKLKDGMDLKILTNSLEAHGSVIPYPAAWYASLADMRDLAEAGAKIYVLKPYGETPYSYLHQKLGIAGRSRTWVGSHNFTRASTTHTDEMSIEIDSPQFAEEMAQRFDQNLKEHGQEMTLADIEAEMGFAYHLWQKFVFGTELVMSLI